MTKLYFFTIAVLVACGGSSLAQDGPLYTDWYLHELNVNEENVPIPDPNLLGEGYEEWLLMKVDYEFNDVQPEFGEQTTMLFFVYDCTYTTIWGDIMEDNTYPINRAEFVPNNGNCPTEIIEFSLKYNNTEDSEAFLGLANITPLTYEITGEGTDMVLKITNSSGDFGIYGLEPLMATNEFNSLSAKITIYPNPVKSSFKLDLPKSVNQNSVKVSIVDSSGKVVKEFKEISDEFDVSSLPSGIYVVIVKDGKNISTSKLIKQ